MLRGGRSHRVFYALFVTSVAVCVGCSSGGGDSPVSDPAAGVFAGSVLDDQGEPVMGARVSINGVESTQLTDADGNYFISDPSLATPEPATLGTSAAVSGVEVAILLPGHQPFIQNLDVVPGKRANIPFVADALEPRVTLTAPTGEKVIAVPSCQDPQVLVEGYAQLARSESYRLDVVVVIDRSGSTGREAFDLDNDGDLETVREAELSASECFLQSLDPETSRVAIVQFDNTAEVVQDFTDPATATTALSAVGDSRWATNYEAAFLLARDLFVDLGAADDLEQSEPSDMELPDPYRAVVFLSDGIPTLHGVPPDPEEDGLHQSKEDRTAAIASARTLGDDTGAELFGFSILPAVDSNRTRTTLPHCVGVCGGGGYENVTDVSQLENALCGRSLVSFLNVEIANVTTGSEPIAANLYPDGFFSELVPVSLDMEADELGVVDNVIEVSLTASAGSVSLVDSATVTVRLIAGEDLGNLSDDEVVSTQSADVPVSELEVKVAVTGQVTSYAAGDDGDVQVGAPWPTPRFVDHGDGTVTDQFTGLMWARDAGLAGSSNWYGALSRVASLNSAVTLGYDDWRLPNIRELDTLVDYGQVPALPAGHPFVNADGGLFWSSTSAVPWWTSSPQDALTKRFGDSVEGSIYKGETLRVWMCRTAEVGMFGIPQTGWMQSFAPGDDGDLQMGTPWPEVRFTDHGDGTVTDGVTGLMWTKDSNPVPAGATWQQALDFVASMNSGAGTHGYTDWRLPNAREMGSLQDSRYRFPCVTSGHPFTDVVYDRYYWSSTTYASDTSMAMAPGFGSGAIGQVPKSMLNAFWPVRGGVVSGGGLELTRPTGGALGSDSLHDFIVSEYEDAVELAGVDTFQVVDPNGLGGAVSVQVDFVFKQACYKSDFGYVAIDPEDPPETAAEALDGVTAANILYNSGDIGDGDCSLQSIEAGTAEFHVDLQDGDVLLFFILPNRTLAEYQSKPKKGPKPLFTMPSLNPGGFDQVLSFRSLDGRTQPGADDRSVVTDGPLSLFAFEDLSIAAGSDQDFADVVFTVTNVLGRVDALRCSD